jgi:hypothetical protein
MFLGGHLQFAAYGMIAVTVLAIGQLLVGPKLGQTAGAEENSPEVRAPRPYRALPAFVAAIALGAVISACQILPVLSYSKFSHRQNTPTADGYEAYLGLALKPFELATLAYPAALGDPRTPIDVGGGQTMSQYWPYFAKPGANFAESAVNIGPLILVGLFLVPWKRRELWPIAAVGLIALLMALGTALNMPLYYFVPGWSAGGSPGRVVVLFVLCSCVLGGIGLGEAGRSSGTKRWMLAATAIALGLLLAFLAPTLAPSPTVGGDAVVQLRGAATTAMLPSLIVALLLTIGGLAALNRYRPVLAVFPVLICLVGYGTNLIMTGKPLDPIPGIPPQERVAFIDQAWEIPFAAKAVAPPNTASLSRIHELGGYDSLLHRDTVALLHDIDGGDPAPHANGNMMFVKPPADRAKLAAAGVTGVWTPDDAQPEPLSGPGRCSVAGGTCRITDEGYDRITVEADGGGTLTLRDRMMPGWEAKVDGKPASVPDGVWRTVDLGSPGHHFVEFRYRPPGLRNGVLLSGAGLLALAILTVLAYRKPPMTNPEETSA